MYGTDISFQRRNSKRTKEATSTKFSWVNSFRFQGLQIILCSFYFLGLWQNPHKTLCSWSHPSFFVFKGKDRFALSDSFLPIESQMSNSFLSFPSVSTLFSSNSVSIQHSQKTLCLLVCYRGECDSTRWSLQRSFLDRPISSLGICWDGCINPCVPT